MTYNYFNFPTLITLLLVTTLFIGCADNVNVEADTTLTYQEEPIESQLQQTEDSTETTILIEEPKEKEDTKPKKKNTKPKKKSTERVSSRELEKLNEFETLEGSVAYNDIVIDYFSSLAKELNGKPFLAPSAGDIDDIILEILSTRVNDATDVVLLIDKTGSMGDDWDVVKSSLEVIMEKLSKYNNVRLGIASYGDLNYHHDFWYTRGDLTYDLSTLKHFMETYGTMGNPDTRESVNDAIVKTVQEMNWQTGSNRVMLVIGDAPTQEPPLSKYSTKEVIDVCQKMDVKFNLYPVIIKANSLSFNEAPWNTDFAKFYPNPAVSEIIIETEESIQMFGYEILNLSGSVLISGSLSSRKQLIDISQLKTGTYLLVVNSGDLGQYYSEKLIVK